MGKMKDIYTEAEEALYEDYLESQRQELRDEGAREAYLMIKHDLETKLKASLMFYQPHDMRPTAFREAIEIVEQYL